MATLSVSPPSIAGTAFREQHYTISELAKLWAKSHETVRKLVCNEPGVLKICLGKKRKHTRYSVPESVAKRIHTRMSA